MPVLPVPFIERYDGGKMVPPHVRVGFLVYSDHPGFHFQQDVTHLLGNFWWRKWEWGYVRYWLGMGSGE